LAGGGPHWFGGGGGGGGGTVRQNPPPNFGGERGGGGYEGESGGGRCGGVEKKTRLGGNIATGLRLAKGIFSVGFDDLTKLRFSMGRDLFPGQSHGGGPLFLLF